MKLLLSARGKKFSGIQELRDIGMLDAALEKLADADASRSIDLDRAKQKKPGSGKCAGKGFSGSEEF